jgi:hypothetical protein
MFFYSVVVALCFLIYVLIEFLLKVYNKKPLWKSLFVFLKKMLDIVMGIGN